MLRYLKCRQARFSRTVLLLYATLLLVAIACAQDDAHSSMSPAPSGNLVVNSSFERTAVEDMPDGWILKAWEGQGSGRVTAGGRFGRNCLRLTSTSKAGLYGCHTQPIEVGRFAGQQMLLSLHYRTEGLPHADALVVSFAGDFTEDEWDTVAVSRHELALAPIGSWTMLSRHLDMPPNARHALVVLRIAGEGSLIVDGIGLRSMPSEVACQIQSAGLVSGAKTRRTDLVLTNRTNNRCDGNVVIQVWNAEKQQATVQQPFQLAAGQAQHTGLEYSLDYRTAHRLRISTYGNQEDEVYDDVWLQVPSLLDAQLMAPAFRSTMIGEIPPDAVVVTGRIHATEQLVRAAEVSARITGTAETTSSGQRIAVNDDGTFKVTLVPPSIASGPYHLSMTARARDLTASLDLPFTKAPPGQRQVAYDHRGLLWVRDNALFPVGLAYLWDPGDLSAAVDARFTFVTVPARTASTAFMDQADAADVGVFISSASVERDFWANAWRKHGNRDSFWGWYILERPDTYGATVRPELLQALYGDLRELSPYNPVLCSLSSSDGLVKFSSTNDVIIAWTETTIPGALDSVARFVTQARQITNASKPVWALIPVAGATHIHDQRLDPEGLGRAPTSAEYRAMVYLSLLCGAQGIVSYAYRIQGDNQRREWLVTRDAPALWQEMQTVNRELSAIGPALLNGTRQALLRVDGVQVQYGVWEHEGQALVVIVNTTNRPQMAHLTVENLTQPLLQSLTGPYRLEGTAQGAFAQQLAPYEVGLFTGRTRQNP